MDYLDKDSVIQVIDDVCKRCDHDECYRKSGREYCPVMDVIDGIKDLTPDMIMDLACIKLSDSADMDKLYQEVISSVAVSPKLLTLDTSSTSMAIQYRAQIERGNK
jgi:hypothetical protein